MAKKSISSKKSLKSLFSKSEANLEESVEKDGSGGGGGKTLKLFKWKKKKKTEPGVDNTEEDKTVSHNESDGGRTSLERNGTLIPNVGEDKKVSIFGTAPRSKKWLLSSSETDLRKPRKFGTFSFGWKKKSKQRAADLSQSVSGLEAPREGLEEEPEPSDLTPGIGRARRQPAGRIQGL
ncbi:hypothetical protein AAFF_G00196710 [Aldrovandia affinis]|uniref:Uncharacterized protein n=1 Tax=Aldrovandia affinis TaxID=143900 RepID=A0AAD7W696_9TELE|nr:hypothetical protein AAFF_G00196710 [Aldrovandia affinis]